MDTIAYKNAATPQDMNYPPICLFVYNRPKETAEVLFSLSKCRRAEMHELYIFSDAARDDSAELQVAAVRRLIRNTNGFKEVHIIEATTNKGLAKSIIAGVSSVIATHERVIVLEDDLILSADFLQYMDDALEVYADDKRIWSISGYSPEIPIPADYNEDVYLTLRASSWGWATWADRWNTIDWDVPDYAEFIRNPQRVERFNLGGNDMSRLLALQQQGRINSWAIRWCYSQFLQGAYTVYPRYSKVMNQGFGTNASHAGWNDARHKVELNDLPITNPVGIQPNEDILRAFKQHQDLSLVSKIGYFLRLYGLGYKPMQKILKFILHRS